MPLGPTQLDGRSVAERLNGALPGVVTASTEMWVEVASDRVQEALRWLRDAEDLDAAQLSNLTAVDRHTYFEIVYHLQSLDLNHQIEVKAIVRNHEDPLLPSVYPVYKGALLQEREVYDLFGIRFDGHPDLRRLFLWEGYPGHPLRKDFLNLGGRVPGLGQFPNEDKANPTRQLNRDNLVSQEMPPEAGGAAMAGSGH